MQVEPCPFCGAWSRAYAVEDINVGGKPTGNYHGYVLCMGCGTQGPGFGGDADDDTGGEETAKSRAVRHWNHRETKNVYRPELQTA